MSSTTYTITEFLDNDFKKLTVQPGPTDTYAVRISEKTVTYLIITTIKVKSIKLIKGDKQVEISEAYYKGFTKKGIHTVEGMLNKISNYNDKLIRLKDPVSQELLSLLKILLLLGFFAIPITLVASTYHKNFSNRVITATSVSQVEVGDFVAMDHTFFISGIDVTEKYDSGSKSKGKSYLYVTDNIGSSNTFIIKINPDSELMKRAEKFKDSDDLDFGKVRGEIEELVLVDHIDEGDQILTTFRKDAARAAKEGIYFNSPKFVLNTDYSQGQLSDVILAVAIATGIEVFLFITLTFLTWRNRSVIKKNILNMSH